MLCRCVASGRPGYVRIVETDGRVAWALCSDCGGSGVASCCDLAGAPNLASSLSRLPQPRGSALDGDGRLARNAGRLRASTSIQKNPVSRWRLTLTCRATGTYPVSRRHQFTGRDRLRQKISLHSRRVRGRWHLHAGELCCFLCGRQRADRRSCEGRRAACRPAHGNECVYGVEFRCTSHAPHIRKRFVIYKLRGHRHGVGAHV